MSENSIYRDLAERTNGSFLLGVVGPVRTGKSSFIKRMMETLVIPHIEDNFSRERAKDELPQSASGKTIMTAEPKFVPEEAVEISLPDETKISVRLIDCVGYMVEGAAGLYEEGEERLVTTPWFDHEVTITEAAEKGTEKVIRDHSSIGIVVTCDGSFGEIPRENFVEAEERVIRELKSLGKPFAVILNSARPQSQQAQSLAAEISGKYEVKCLCMSCLSMSEHDIAEVLASVLEEYPLRALRFYLPDWVDALPEQNECRQRVFRLLKENAEGLRKIKDLCTLKEEIADEEISLVLKESVRDLGSGEVSLRVEMPRCLYYQTISRETGLSIGNDADLIRILSEMAASRRECEQLGRALAEVREKGYGVVLPAPDQMRLEEPQIVRQNGKYSVRLRAGAPAIHLLMTDVETEVSPAIGGESASEDIISFLLQGFEGDVNRIWQSNIFGRSLNELAEEGLRSKLENLPDAAREKLRLTLERIINEGCAGLICLLL